MYYGVNTTISDDLINGFTAALHSCSTAKENSLSTDFTAPKFALSHSAYSTPQRG